MDIVLDASVAIKWFKGSDEDYVDSALSIQDRKLSGSIEIIVPDLFFLRSVVKVFVHMFIDLCVKSLLSFLL